MFDLEQCAHNVDDQHCREGIAHVIEVVSAERKGL